MVRLAPCALLVLLLTSPAGARAADLPSEIKALIAEAGNTPDDALRLAKLRELARHPAAADPLRREAAGLAEIAEAWNKSAGGEAFRLTRRAADQTQTDEFEFQTADDSPLAPLAHLYRGRMLAWKRTEANPDRRSPDGHGHHARR